MKDSSGKEKSPSSEGKDDYRYVPSLYWEALIAEKGGLEAVGHAGMGAYNSVAYRVRLRALKKMLEEHSNNLAASRVFEAGFGVGFYTGWFEKQGVRALTGLDISSTAVEQARRLFPQYEFMQGDLAGSAWDFGRNYDLVTAIDVLYHIVDDEKWELVLKRLCSLVASQGKLVITDKFPKGSPRQDCVHVRRRPLRSYEPVLNGEGFEVVRVSPIFVFMDGPITTGVKSTLGFVSAIQWRIIQGVLRRISRWPKIRDIVGAGTAWIQYPLELAALSLIGRSPNLEMLLAEKRHAASPLSGARK